MGDSLFELLPEIFWRQAVTMVALQSKNLSAATNPSKKTNDSAAVCSTIDGYQESTTDLRHPFR